MKYIMIKLLFVMYLRPSYLTSSEAHVSELLAIQFATVVYVETPKGVSDLGHLIGQAIADALLSGTCKNHQEFQVCKAYYLREFPPPK